MAFHNFWFSFSIDGVSLAQNGAIYMPCGGGVRRFQFFKALATMPGAFLYIRAMKFLPKSGFFKTGLFILFALLVWAIYIELYWIPFKRPAKIPASEPAARFDRSADKPPDVSKEFLARYEVYLASPTDAAAQLSYINAFPKTKDGFKTLFDPNDLSALYSRSDKYISPLSTLAEKYPSEVEHVVLPIILGGAPNCCDGWSWLSTVAEDLYKGNGRKLGDTLKTLSHDQQLLLARYLTYVENPEYRARDCQEYMVSLRKYQLNEQANLFETACRERFIH